MDVRGKECQFSRHAHEGMAAERPAIQYGDVYRTLEDADSDDGHKAIRRIKRRTIIVYYAEYVDAIVVRGVSATRTRLAP